jgi:hypothetical protein
MWTFSLSAWPKLHDYNKDTFVLYLLILTCYLHHTRSRSLTCAKLLNTVQQPKEVLHNRTIYALFLNATIVLGELEPVIYR